MQRLLFLSGLWVLIDNNNANNNNDNNYNKNHKKRQRMTLQQVHHQIETTPLRPYQMLIVALGVLINLLDGYDILALSIISPVITREWG
ncbi:MAG: hypothetical protein V4603_00865, partial [Pseudomonadota bacterium]